MESGFLAAVDILVNHYLPESEFARKSAPNQLGLFGEEELAAAVAPKSRARNLRKPANGQMSFNWDEESHPREATAHDGKRPGEFAPKEHAEHPVEPEPEHEPSEIERQFPSLAGHVEPEPSPADDLESQLRAIEAVPENEDEKNEIRRMKGWTQERIDAYDPLTHVRKLSGGGWIATGIEGTDWPTVFKTKKAAVNMTEQHKKLKQAQFDNPTGYANLASLRAEKNLGLIEKYMKQGMSEMDAGKKAREDEAAGYPEPQPNPISNSTPQKPPRKKSTLTDAIAASNKKNEPEGGWTDADRVPGSYSDPHKADITEQFPSLKGFTEEPKAAEAPAETKSVWQLPPEQFDAMLEKQANGKSPENSGPLTLAKLDERKERINTGKATADEVRQWHKELSDPANIEAIKAEFNKQSVAELKSKGATGYYNRQKKSDLIESIMDHIGDDYDVSPGGLSYMMGSNMKQAKAEAIQKKLAGLTDQHIADHAARLSGVAEKRQEASEAVQEGIKNPQTLDDFRNAVRHYGGYANMPEDIQVAFDEFAANRRRETAAQSKAKVTGFSGGTEATGATSIVEGHHQKRGVPTYTVTVEKHLGDGWGDALSRAKQLGGSYVNGRIAKAYHATPGFQFFNRADAEKFQKSLGGEEVDRSDRLDEKNIARMDNASERLAALSEATKKRAEEKLHAPRQTNTHRRAEHAAGAQAQARSEAAKAETMQRISEGLASGSLKHLGGIRARTHVDTLDSLLHSAKLNAWRDSKSTSQDSYEEMRERDATPQDIAKAKYPYPRIWDHELAEHLDELSQIPGLKNIARDLKKSTEKSPYKKKIGKISISGGEAKTADQLSDIPLARGLVKDKAVRIHVSQDSTLLKGRHPVAYTADGGKTWGTTQDIAVSAAVHGEINGTSKLDLIDPPQHEQVEIKDPDTIANIQKAIKILKRKSNPRLKRVAESLGQHMEDYNRLQSMDITTPMELRAALREYMPLKKRQDKEDPVKAKERSLVGRKIDGFFPTPRPAIDKMLAAADIQPGMSVLEPSAGKGDILDAVKEQHPDAKTIGIETNSDLRDLIGMKGHELHDDTDFLQHNGQYDRIVMNPPFENRADVSHVMRAYQENLKPGGRLVAIMGAGVFGGSSKKDQEFRDWLESHDAEIEHMPEGSFSGPDSFRKTGVNTRMVVMNKPDTESQFSRDIRTVLHADFSAKDASFSSITRRKFRN